MKKKKIIIISGGGCFGHIPVCFLRNALNGGILPDNIDCIAGTSIGGILSLYLADNKTSEQLYQDFIVECPKIFSRSFWSRLNPLSSKYGSEGIEGSLKRMLPGRMSDLKTKVVVPALNFHDDVPKLFSNIDYTGNYVDKLNWEVGRATSAAPTYFPPFSERIYLDGGIIENIPIMSVTSLLCDKLGWKPADMDVMVIGTGYVKPEEKSLTDVSSYSAISWLNKFLVPYVTKSNEISSLYCGQFCGFNQFIVFNPVEIEGGMDNTDMVVDGSLEKKCEPYYEEFKKTFFGFLSNPREINIGTKKKFIGQDLKNIFKNI